LAALKFGLEAGLIRSRGRLTARRDSP